MAKGNGLPFSLTKDTKPPRNNSRLRQTIASPSPFGSGSSFTSVTNADARSQEQRALAFARHQTVETLPQVPPEARLHPLQPSRDLFRTYTESDLNALRTNYYTTGEGSTSDYNRHVGDDYNGPLTPQTPRTPRTPRTPSRTPSSAAIRRRVSNWGYRVFTRPLPRSLRWHANGRNYTRYMTRGNTASLQTRLRKKREPSFNEADEGPGLSASVEDPALVPQRSMSSSVLSMEAWFNSAAETMGYEVKGESSRIVSINGGGPADFKDTEPVVEAPEEEEEEEFASNEIHTYQYTWWSFVPVFLYLQFSKTANLYFLLIGILQLIPSISPTEGVPLQFIPLTIVTVIDALFAAYEDYKRHEADDEANSTKTVAFNRFSSQFETCEWRDLKVGDFIRLENHETVPADVLILAVTPAEGSNAGGAAGVCYVETKNLDGETNLKLREAPSKLSHAMFLNEENADKVGFGYVESEAPNGDINKYSGTMYLDGFRDDDLLSGLENGKERQGMGLNLKNMLLRGSRVRNTKQVYALVVNTGVDCKIMRSSGDGFAVKVSSIDEMTNRQVIMVVILLVIICLIGAIGNQLWSWDDMGASEKSHEMLDDKLTQTAIGAFVYWFTMLASMVPITLYVCITLVKALQGKFMQMDLDMYDPASDSPMLVRNMQLNEQLGQISHVFSDKTGTLTCNIMEFRKCSINGVKYGKGTTAIGRAARMRDDFVGDPVSEEEDDDLDVKEMVENVNFKDASFWQHIGGQSTQSTYIRDFFLHLALCHGVLIEEDEEKHEIKYSASSPDEQALVCGAKYVGFEFVKREPGSVWVKNPEGQVEIYEVLEVFEFDSARKRMTIVVQRRRKDTELRQMTSSDDDEGDEVLILTKGADSALVPRLQSGEEEHVKKTLDHLEAFARDGLRTLVVCSKKLTHYQWQAFHVRYRAAIADMNEVGKLNRGEENLISRLQEEMESDLQLLGATAIEDRLQDGVPETMERLAIAGIGVWVLTGDMEETAINIGYACRLLHNGLQRHVINSASYETKARILKELDRVFHAVHDDPEGDGHALVIDGASLNLILPDPLLNLHLLRLALLCKVVIACRVSPQQKAQLVELVKVNVETSHTLAIGDGANDVPMIQAAHVGVGISGQEGMQAVNTSDFALAQFRFLAPLLLTHGRWNYDRIAALVVYTFYKNVAYCLSLFWYTLAQSGYSGTMVYTAFIQQGYNLFFTSFPIVILAVFDKDVPRQSTLDFPVLYHHQARERSEFTYAKFWYWIVMGFIDSVLIYFVFLGASYTITGDGGTMPFEVLQSTAWTVLCIAVNARFCVMVRSWDQLEMWGLLVSVLFIYLAQWLVDELPLGYETGSFPWVFGSAEFWMGQILAVAVILAKDVFIETYLCRFRPSYLDLVRETTLASDRKIQKSFQDVKATDNDDSIDYVRQETPANAQQEAVLRDEENQMSPVEGHEAAIQRLKDVRPPQPSFLTTELASMMDYRERRMHEAAPVPRSAPRRAPLYRGFAFEQPAQVFDWILSGPQSRKQTVDATVRQRILNSDDPVIFENERYQPFCGFGSTYPGYLLPTDRSRWSDRSGKISAMAIPLMGLELDLDVPGADSDGWIYAKDFKLFNVNKVEPPTGGIGGIPPGLVRRRQWKLSDEYREKLRDSRASSVRHTVV